jgi:hypothetical protein
MSSLLSEILKEVVTPLTKFGLRTATGWIAYQVTHPEGAGDLPFRVDLAEYEQADLAGIVTLREKDLESGEQEALERMLSNAQRLYQGGKPDDARAIIEEAMKTTTCGRCRENMGKIAENPKTAPQKIAILRGLIPSYLTVHQEEERLRSVEEECLPCLADKIVTICGGDPDCLVYAARVKKDEPTVTPPVVIKRVEDFVSKRRKELGIQ